MNAARFLVANLRSARAMQREALETIRSLTRSHGKPHWDLAFFRTMIDSERVSRENGHSVATLHMRRARTEQARFYRLASSYRSALNDSKQKRIAFDQVNNEPTTDPVIHFMHLAHRANADDALVNARKDLLICMNQHNLQSRYPRDADIFIWLDSQEGKIAADNAVWEAYEDALDHLELACMSRMQELDRCSRPGTSYKLRAKIQAGLNARSAGLETSLKKYQTARLALPIAQRPPLIDQSRWTENQEAVSESFACLRDQRHFGAELWTQPHIREGVRATRHYDCAMKELARMRTEAARLQYWLVDQRNLLCTIVNTSNIPPTAIWDSLKHPVAHTKPRQLLPAMAVCCIMERLKTFDLLAAGLNRDFHPFREDESHVPLQDVPPPVQLHERFRLSWCRWTTQDAGTSTIDTDFDCDEDSIPAGADEVDPIELATMPGMSEESYAVF